MQLGQTLLALVTLELSPELELLIDQLQGFLVIAWQLYFFPELLWEMGTLGCFHVEVTLAFVLQDCGVAAVREWTGVPVAHAREVVFVSAKGLGHCF